MARSRKDKEKREQEGGDIGVDKGKREREER